MNIKKFNYNSEKSQIFKKYNKYKISEYKIFFSLAFYKFFQLTIIGIIISISINFISNLLINNTFVIKNKKSKIQVYNIAEREGFFSKKIDSNLSHANAKINSE